MKLRILLLGVAAARLWAAGTCTVQQPQPATASILPPGVPVTSFYAQVSCTADASNGSFPAAPISGLLSTAVQLQGWYVTAVQITPGSPAPTAGYGLTVTNAQSVDQLGGSAASLSATASQAFYAVTPTPIIGIETVNFTGNSVNSAKTTVNVYFGQTTVQSGGSGAFSGITSGTNVSAAMVCGTGCSLTTSGSGTITATGAPPSGTAGGDLSGTYPNPKLKNVYMAVSNGLSCDGTTDDTPSFNSLLTTVASAGGGTIQIPIGECLIAGHVVIPNDGTGSGTNAYSRQTGIRLTGSGPDFRNGEGLPPGTTYGGSTLKLTYAGTGTTGALAYSMIDAQGSGYAVNDTGTIGGTCSGTTYKVLAVDASGAVTNYSVTAAGSSCSVADNIATTTGGGQPGAGTAFTVNVTYVVGSNQAKIETYALGYLEIDHLTLRDSGSDSLPFVYTTGTTLNIHDNAFYGTGSTQDAILLGGPLSTFTGTNNVLGAFQGYDSAVDFNYFNHIRRAVLAKTFLAALHINRNFVGPGCGTNLSRGAAFEVYTPQGSVGGNSFWTQNRIEITSYQFAFKFWNTPYHYVEASDVEDASGGSIGLINYVGGANFNTAIIPASVGVTPVVSDSLSSRNTLISAVSDTPSLFPTGLGTLSVPSGFGPVSSGTSSAASFNAPSATSLGLLWDGTAKSLTLKKALGTPTSGWTTDSGITLSVPQLTATTLNGPSTLSGLFTVLGTDTNTNTIPFKIQNSTPASLFSATDDGRIYIGSNNGNNVTLSVDMLGPHTSGHIARFADSSGAWIFDSGSLSSSNPSVGIGTGSFGQALYLNVPGANNMLQLTGTFMVLGATTKTQNLVLADPTTNTKLAAFSMSGISASTTRTFSFPDKTGTFAMTSDLPPAILSGTTSSIGGSVLIAGACSSGTVTVTGATTGMVATASPAGGVDPTNGNTLGVSIDARVSAADTVMVAICSPIAGTPTAATYNVRVIQ